MSLITFMFLILLYLLLLLFLISYITSHVMFMCYVYW